MFDYVRSTENSQRSDSRRGRRPLTSRSPYRDIVLKFPGITKGGVVRCATYCYVWRNRMGCVCACVMSH